MMFNQKKKSLSKKRLYIYAGLVVINLTIITTFITTAHTLQTKDQRVLNETLSREEEPVLDGGEELISEVPEKKTTITVHTVTNGETLSTIAEEYGISVNTIRWANEISPKSVIRVGQKLTILPVTGISYKVGKGDTLISLAKQYGSDVEEIKEVNGLDDGKIVVGQVLIIPDAMPKDKVTPPTPSPKKTVSSASKVSTEQTKKESETISLTTTPEEKKEVAIVSDTANNGAVPKVSVSGIQTKDYFIHPVPGSILTQGFHGYNSVDFGAPKGTPILAAADGTVIVEKGAGKWYGGYGNYIVIEHDNGTQTLYAHNSKNLVSVGDVVKQGQQIALVGSTGRSSGPHLHFEVRGGTNPWVGKPKGTQY